MSTQNRDLFEILPFRYWDEELNDYASLLEGQDVTPLIWGSKADAFCRILSRTQIDFDPVKLSKYEKYLVNNGYKHDYVNNHLKLLKSPMKVKLRERRGRFSYEEMHKGGIKSAPSPVTVGGATGKPELLIGGRPADSMLTLQPFYYEVQGYSGMITFSANRFNEFTVSDGKVAFSESFNGEAMKRKAEGSGLRLMDPAQFGLEQGEAPTLEDMRDKSDAFVGWIVYVCPFSWNEDGDSVPYFAIMGKKIDAPFGALLNANTMHKGANWRYILPKAWTDATREYVETELLPNLSSQHAANVRGYLNSWFNPGDVVEQVSGSGTASGSEWFAYGTQSNFDQLKVEFSTLDDVKLGSWSAKRGEAEMTWSKFRPSAMRATVEGQLQSKKLSSHERKKLESALLEMDKSPDTEIGVILYNRAQRLPIDPLDRVDVASFGLPGGISIDDEVLFDDGANSVTWKQASRRVTRMESSDFFYAIDNPAEGSENVSLTTGAAKTHCVLVERKADNAVEFFIATKANTLPVTDAIDSDEALIHLQEGYPLTKGGTFRGLERWEAMVCAALDVPSLSSVVQTNSDGKAFSMSSVDLKRYDIRRYYQSGYLPWHQLSDEDRDYAAILSKGTEFGGEVRETFATLCSADFGKAHLDLKIAFGNSK